MLDRRTITVSSKTASSSETPRQKRVSVSRAPWEKPDEKAQPIPSDDWFQAPSWPPMGVKFKQEMWERWQ